MLAMRKRRARRLMRRQSPLSIDIMVKSALWKEQRGAKAVLRRAIAEAACAVAAGEGELAIVLTDDSSIRTLNRDWRSKDASTDVLSFPATNNLCPSMRSENGRGTGKRATRSARPAGVQAVGAKGRKTRSVPRLLGDIVIAYETTEREAHTERKPFADHLAHLAIHGFLHLLGYGHATGEEAKAMERVETAILTRLDVPNPHVSPGAKGDI
jgi:probable rRNA maturation factor